MADESAEVTDTDSGEAATNGHSSSAIDYAAIKAEFMARAGEPEPKAKSESKIEAAADDDSDLDADDEESTEDTEDSDEDEDSDLDEDDDESDAEDTDEGKLEATADKDTAKRVDQVRRTDKRLRQERERLEKERDADFERRVAAFEKQWAPRIEAAETFERLKARASVDPVAVLQALGVGEDRYEYIARVLHTTNKAKGGDEDAKSRVAQIMKDRERDEEFAQLKKKFEDNEKSAKDREAAAADERKWNAYFDSAAKLATDKTPLSKHWLKSNPTAARERMSVLALRHIESTGKVPTERDVIVALEKDRRQALRDLDIDPKTRSMRLATGTPAKSAPKKGDKKPAPAAKAGDQKKLSAKEEFVRLNGNYD